MNHTLYAGFDAYGDGFFVDPIDGNDPAFQSDPDKDIWIRIQNVLFKAKAGDFSEMSALPDLCDSDNLALAGVCYHLLAHAGTPACFSRMKTIIRASFDWEMMIDFCMALGQGDTLSAVPLILDTYVSLWQKGANGVEMLAHTLGYVVGIPHPRLAETGPVRAKEDLVVLENHRQAVMDRYHTLCEKFGTDQVYVAAGEAFDVIAQAKQLLRDIQKGRLSWPGRIHFEASTGIDCRSFYQNGSFQPLRAAAIVEDFLKRPVNYEPGVRYFFGHRIPATSLKTGQ